MKKSHKRAAAISRRLPDVAVIGAGTMGGWTAWHLLQQGARVVLIDAWGAGHSRGTSSDHSRIIRCGYGPKEIYSRWTWRALQHWKRWQAEWRVPLFENCGVLWLGAEEAAHTQASLATLRRLKIPVEKLSRQDLRRRAPGMNTEDVTLAYFEPRGGYLRAALAMRTVAGAVARHPRGSVKVAQVGSPGEIQASKSKIQELPSIRLGDGTQPSAGAFVFACGPWLPQLFPDALGNRIRVTKQEVFYFGVPPGDLRFTPSQQPAWIEVTTSFYGIPAGDGCGLKVADDSSTALFDPTHGERTPAPEREAAARKYLARRFPLLAQAPLVEAKVCQYERTPDSHLVIDRHPAWRNVWLAGGGSGHGFKLGPAVGEFAAHLMLGKACAPLGLRVARGGDPRESIPAELRLGATAFSDSPSEAELARLRSI